MLIDAPIRKTDKFGSGAYLAPRGKRKHKGIDISCYAESKVLSVSPGVVTKIGFPYNPKDTRKGHLRYVQVTDAEGLRVRYFYVSSVVDVGQSVDVGTVLGLTQGLEDVYPGITDHFHFEVLDDSGLPVNPESYLSRIGASTI